LVPTAEALGPLFGFEFPHMAGKIRAFKKGEDLAKQTAGGIHLDLRG
jgi:hypothetical protein